MAGYLLNLLLLGAVVLGVVFWWQTQGVRQLAYGAAQRRCEELGLQLLDQGIMLCGVGLERGRDGRISVRRRFVFEFASTGDERYCGEVWMLGQRLERIELEPQRL